MMIRKRQSLSAAPAIGTEPFSFSPELPKLLVNFTSRTLVVCWHGSTMNTFSKSSSQIAWIYPFSMHANLQGASSTFASGFFRKLSHELL